MADQPLEPEPDSVDSAPQRVGPLKPAVERSLFARALPRWGVVLGILSVLSAVYLQHPYYRGGTFAAWRNVFPVVLGGWMLLGLPFLMLTLRKFSSRKLFFSDTPLLWLVLLRVASGTRNLRVWQRKRLRNTILGGVVKAFFSPLMVGFFTGHVLAFSNRWLRLKGGPTLPNVPGSLTLDGFTRFWSGVGNSLEYMVPAGSDVGALFQAATYSAKNIRWGLDHAYDAIFMIDCGIALIGYCMETRWLNNKTKSVEPTGFGWTVALACYPPFNNILGTYMPFKDVPNPGHFSPEVNLWIKAAVVFLFAIYASATVAFGFKFSNLTNRGIITRGPYRFVRHPAYLTKCCAWWLEHANNMSVQTGLALVALCSVYGWRAWTEERHLLQDPDYVAYKKKVPWVVFPGIY